MSLTRTKTNMTGKHKDSIIQVLVKNGDDRQISGQGHPCSSGERKWI